MDSNITGCQTDEWFAMSYGESMPTYEDLILRTAKLWASYT
jgi:hypothetical protein